MSEKIFCYGTLIYPELFHAITGVRADYEPALIHGYVRRQINGEAYPGIKPASSGVVEGVVYSFSDNTVLRKLDQYEGALYQRITVMACVEGGRESPVWVYCVKPAFYNRLDSMDWDRQWFERNYKNSWLSRYSR